MKQAKRMKRLLSLLLLLVLPLAHGQLATPTTDTPTTAQEGEEEVFATQKYETISSATFGGLEEQEESDVSSSPSPPTTTALPSSAVFANPPAELPEVSQINATEVPAANILTAGEVELYERSLATIGDAKCRQDLNATLQGLLVGQQWAIAMYDATAKSTFGIESGLLHHFGHYDECLNQNIHTAQRRVAPSADGHAGGAFVRAKYCLASVRLPGLNVRNVDTRKAQPLDSVLVHWGVCVPASCNGRDVAAHLQTMLQHEVLPLDEARSCQLRAHELHVSGGMFTYAFVIYFFILLTLLSTAYHAYLLAMARRHHEGTKNGGVHKQQTISRPRNDVLYMALLAFSVIENTKKLFQVSKDQLGLNSINGIKALAMLFILVGHALSFIYGGVVYNPQFISEHIKLPTFAFLSNSLLFVDIFLLLSGFLFCRILLIELQRRRGQINALVLYVGRYVRLTPAYMAIIGFYMTWLPHAGDGPLWRQRIELERERCQQSWWLNILYVNNYFGTDHLCMFQSWYLSVDTQLFIVAPIFMYLLYRRRRWGVALLGVSVGVTTLVPFVATYVRKLDPTLMVYADEVTDLGSNAFYIGSYIKTHMRAAAYVIGLLTGYIVHLMHENSIRLSKWWVRLGWACSVAIGIASMFSVSRFYASSFTTLESTMYSGFHKLGWNLSVAWLVIAVTTGHGGWLQRLLASHFFAPISRLTYCAYLSNGIVELYHAASVRNAAYTGYISLINEVVAHILDTFLLAFVLCLLFESPIHALERILLRRHRPSAAAASVAAGANNGQAAAATTGSADKESGNHTDPGSLEENHTPSTSEERV